MKTLIYATMAAIASATHHKAGLQLNAYSTMYLSDPSEPVVNGKMDNGDKDSTIQVLCNGYIPTTNRGGNTYTCDRKGQRSSICK